MENAPVKLTKSGKPDRRCFNPIMKNGRPKGMKNKTTIFKEAMQQGFEESLQKNFKQVLEAVVAKAKDGDMQAAKLLLDRVVPVQRSVDMADLEKGKGLQISINIGSLEKQVDGIEIEDAEYTDAD